MIKYISESEQVIAYKKEDNLYFTKLIILKVEQWNFITASIAASFSPDLFICHPTSTLQSFTCSALLLKAWNPSTCLFFFHVMNKHEIWKMMGFYSCRVYDFKMAKKFSSLSITENLDVKLTCYFNAFFSSVYNARSCHCQGIYSYLSYREKAIMCRFISFFSSPVLRHTFCYADIGCKFIQLCPEANWTQGFHI